MIQGKTNAMRILDSNKINYSTHSYENKDDKLDCIAVAHKIEKDVNQVFKTLVTQGHSKDFYVFVIPVSEELDMKKIFKTFIQEDALLFDTIIFSGGKIGAQIEMDPNDISKVIECSFVDIIK